ncbi:hypothetical protein GQ457_06G003040 [Hibiscus cannabinus]
MSLESQVKLPVIEFSDENLKPGSSAWASACTDVRRALEECGCFEAKFEKMPRQVRDAAFAGAEELFGLPTEVKLRNTNDKPGFHYFGQFEFMPLYESLAVENPTSFDATSNFTRLMWPDGNDRFRESAQSFSEPVTELDRIVARMLFESYGVGHYYDYYSKNTCYLLRYFGYREPMPDQTNAGILPHTDKTFFSILHQGDIGGLMVKMKDGRWVDVPASPTSFVVMAGDALMIWSNDRIQSCYHQVIMKEKKRRYSLGIFSFVNGTIHIPEELVDETHPIRYKSFDNFELLKFFSSKQKMPLIKDFCGI